MNSCTDPKFEQIIHGYELGVLSQEEVREFEMHVLDCEYCFEHVREMLPTSILLRHDADVQAVWPSSDGKKFKYSKLLLIAALVVLAVVPIYRFGIIDEVPSGTVQQINFLPMRANGNNHVEIGLGGIVEIRFNIEGATRASTYRVNIRSSFEDTVFSANEYSDFTDFGAALISLPVSLLSEGAYILTIGEPQDDTTKVVAEYLFQAN